MRRPGLTGDIWPDPIQELLLRTALLPGTRSAVAWASVRPRIDIDHLPGELHRLMPLLWQALSVRGTEDPDLARLKGVYQYSWYRNTMLWTEAAGLLGELTAAAVPTMLLRGAAIGLAYREDGGVRPMNDIDILVPETDIGRARGVAAGAGWRPVNGSQPLERQLAAAPLRSSSGRMVRLHWQPSPHLELTDGSSDGLWQRARHLRARGKDTSVPSAADHLVHACVDGARANSGSSLRWITDAMALLTAPGVPLDWDVVVSEARRLHVALLMAEVLRYLKEALDAEVSQAALDALGRSPSTRRERVAHRLSLTTTPRVPSAAENLGRFVRLTADRSLLETAAAAPKFLRIVSNVEKRQHLPVAVLKKVTRAVISPSPPLASPSRAGLGGIPPMPVWRGRNRMLPESPRVDRPGPHPSLLEVGAGRGLPKVSDPMPMLRSALAHGMSGLLLTEVERTDQPWRRLLLPLLKARQASVEAWHQRLWSGLETVREIFDDMGVEVAIAKGVAAEARWYSRLGERPCNDLDLLLSPAQLGRIDDIISAIEPSHPLCGKTYQLAKQGLLQSIDLKYEGVPIDLHWDIFKIGIPSRNLDEIWERTVPFSLPNGNSLRALDPESSFVHFLVHLNKDKFRRLLGFVDPARVYHREELDEEAIERLVRADGIKTCVDASWNVVVDTLDLKAPRRTPTPGMRSILWQLAWGPTVRLRAEDSRVRFRHRQYLIALLSPGRTTEAVQHWIRGRFPPPELLTYVHSDYAARWGGDAVTDAPHSWLWSLTVGRVKAWLGRRHRVARTAQQAGPKWKNKQKISREPGGRREPV